MARRLPSATAIAEYELVLMLDPETPEDAREKLTGDVRGRIEAAGELRHDENWGMRKLAYEIEKRNEADYRFFRFQGEPQLLDELRHSLKIAEGVLRFRVFGVDPRTPVGAAPPPVQAARPPRESRGGRDGKPRRSDGDGGYDWSVKGLNRVVYHLPDIQRKEAVFIVEGEKDCDRLWSVGLPATTCSSGADKWREIYTEQLTAAGIKRVAVIPDNDAPQISRARVRPSLCAVSRVDPGRQQDDQPPSFSSQRVSRR